MITLLQGQICVDGSTHLIGGDGVSRGRLEYCYNGEWYSVCADGWDTILKEVRVVCHSMGLTTRKVVYFVTFAKPISIAAAVLIDYGRGTSPILPLNVKCDGAEDTLSECLKSKLNPGQCTRVVGIDCRGNAYMNDQLLFLVLIYNIITAHCVFIHTNDCQKCRNRPLFCSTSTCSCHPDCFLQGNCCADASFIQEICQGI